MIDKEVHESPVGVGFAHKDNKVKYDKCVMCGAKTEYTKDTHIDFRNNYVEGAGQMCQDCHTKIY